MSDEAGIHGRVDRLFRERAGQLVSTLARALGPAHLALAEDAVQDAMVAALRTWPFRGIPDDPAAWLARVARNRALDLLRRDATLARKEGEVTAAMEALATPSPGATGGLDDDRLRMMFACCHPALPRDARVALTLKLVGGLSVDEIARAFLARPEAVAQRLVRAKRRLRDERAAFDVPDDGPELTARLDSVLEVVYLVFNEGHAAHAGERLTRDDLCEDALRMALLLARHPRTARPATHALCALLCFHAARLPVRADADGGLVPLADQDRSRWDGRWTAAGFRWLGRSASGDSLSPYHLEAEIAAVHAAAATYGDTDWRRIVDGYDRLMALCPSPVAALNRAVAVSMADGAGRGLADAEAAGADGSLDGYAPYHVTRGDLLARLGRAAEADEAFVAALALQPAEPVRRFIERKRRALESGR